MQAEADRIVATRLGAGKTFVFSSGAVGEATMKQVFMDIAPTFTQMVADRLNALGAPGFLATTWSKEMVTLVSLAFNGGPKLIGQGLANAIRDDNRALAWYEIRFGSNKKRDFGLQNRRNRESDMFGLFETGGGSYPPSINDAMNAYRVMTPRYQAIDTYLNAIVHYGNAGNVIRGIDKTELTTARNTFAAALNPGKEVVFADLQQRYSAGMAGLSAGDFVATNIYLDPNRGPGDSATTNNLDHSAYLNSIRLDAQGNEVASNDILIGEGGIDWLRGGKGDDVLIGGQGRDVYIYREGDGNDRIIDEDRQGTIIILGRDGSQKNTIAVETFLKDPNDGNVWHNLDGSITLTHNSPWKLILADGSTIDLGDTFQDGDFGIDLKDSPTATVTEIVGDLKPIDFNIATPAEDLQYDSLGNVIVSTTEAPGREDSLYGSGNAETIRGLAGNDVINGQGGNDLIEGGSGSGNDLLAIDSDARFNNFRDKNLPVFLYGNDGNEVFAGFGGNDVIDGGDTLAGGAGNDVLQCRHWRRADGSAEQGERNDMRSTANDAVFEIMRGKYEMNAMPIPIAPSWIAQESRRWWDGGRHHQTHERGVERRVA